MMFWDSFDVAPVSLFFLVLFLLVTCSYLSRAQCDNLPPGPPSFPVIGSLPYMVGDTRAVFSRLAAKYGHVFTVDIGSQRAVVLNGYETIKQAILKTPNVYDGRSDMFREYGRFNNGITCSQGDVWKVQRRFLLHSLRNFGLGKRPMEVLVQDEVRHLVDELKNACGAPFDMNGILMKAVSNIILITSFGRRYDYEDPALIEMLRDLTESFDSSGFNNPAFVFKFLQYIPGDPFGFHKGVDIAKAFNKRYQHEVEIRKAVKSQDMVGLFLKKIPEWKETGDAAFFENQLVYVMSDLFAAGTDTTSQTLQWAVLYLILNPDIQGKVQKEIGDVIGGERSPCMQDRQNMPYTDAVLSEVQRIGDILPGALPHTTLEDTILNGYTIPKGTIVIPNLHSIHWDPVLWPDPARFDPHRFLDDDGKYRKKEEFIPFSIGKRSCPGEGLAKMELFLFLTHLLQSFTFSVPPNQPKPTTEGMLGITYHPKDFKVIMTLRK